MSYSVRTGQPAFDHVHGKPIFAWLADHPDEAALFGDNAGGNIAHIGGAIIGFIFIKQLQRGVDMGRPIHAIGDFFANLFSGRPKMKATFNSSAPGPKTNTKVNGNSRPDQSEIDVILDKISASGYESLTKEEKQKLFRASQK